VIQDVELKLGGVDAASPLSTGIVMNILTPRGGNVFTGSASYQYQPVAWNGTNVDSGKVQGGLPRVQGTKQADLALGGPIVRDQVWFFSSYRRADLTDGVSRVPLDLTLLTEFRPDFQPFNNAYTSNQPFVKVTAKVSAKHEFSTFYEYDVNNITTNTNRDEDQVHFSTLGGSLAQAKLSSVWTDHLTSSFAAAYNTKSGNNMAVFNMNPGVGPQVNVHQSTFLSSGIPTGTGTLVMENNVSSLSYLPASILNFRGDVTYYQQGWGGSHEFRTGIWASPKLNRDIVTRYLNDGSTLEEVRQIDPNNPAAGLVPFHYQYQSPTLATTTSARDRDIGVYVQDAWKPNPRVTVNAGVRVDFVRRHDAIFNIDRMNSASIGPRLGVAYQVTKDARTVLRASYARVAEQVNGRDVITPFASGLPVGATLRDVYVNPDGTQTTIITPAATAALSSLEFNPSMHQPFVDEFVVGLRRQLPGQISVDVSATRRYYRDGYALVDINGIYPSGPNEAFAGFGKVDPNRGIIYQQTNSTWNWVVLTGFETAVTKNLAHNFQFLLGLNAQWAHEAGTWNPTDPARFIQPNAFPNNRMLILGFGNQDNNTLNGGGQTQYSAWRPYSARAAGQYFAPLGIMLAASFVVTAGDYSGAIVTKIAAPDPLFGPSLVTLSNGTTQPNPLATTIRFAFPTRGDGQVENDTASTLQFTVGRPFKVGRLQFDPQLNIFNVFNDGAQNSYNAGANQLYSANYLQPFNRLPPRVFAVTLRAHF
jgi:hypothetical protein